MRFLRLVTSNIGGLHDSDIQLPDEPVLAFAGANGTGKSKLLACLLAPWTQQLPSPPNQESTSQVTLTIRFDDHELDAFERLDREMNWNGGRPSAVVELSCSTSPLGGFSMTPQPWSNALKFGFSNPRLLQWTPSLNLIYLPAERRLLPPNSPVLDLSQLAEEVSLAKAAEARGASANFGRLDDQEFESYAKALCVAGTLPSDGTSATSAEEDISKWQQFKSAVDTLLHPKELLGLTRENPSHLFVRLPSGAVHRVQDLSSGERQALIIMSRVFRAGEGHSIVAIDEPDAYLHSTLSARLLSTLRPGLRQGARLLLATHSPAILDGLPAEAIYRLSHEAPARVVASETERVRLYREAGFRASALTQAQLLLVTEGDFDAVILPLLLPPLASAAIRGVGGRQAVIRNLEALTPYDLPVFGIVDADVQADAIPRILADRCHVWSCADIEGVMLRDEAWLEAAVAGSLVKRDFRSVPALQSLLDSLLAGFQQAAVAELAQRELRKITSITWPKPRSIDALKLLRDLAGTLPQLTTDAIDGAISDAEATWRRAGASPWGLVRGKWLLPHFVKTATDFRSGEAFLLAVATRQPAVAEIQDLGQTLQQVLPHGAKDL